MGRGKIEIKRIENSSNRQVTYSKRRNGIMKKAREITVLCDAQVSLVIFASSGKMHEYRSPSTTLIDILDRYQRQSGKRLWDARHQSLSNELDRIKKENDRMQIELRHLKGEDITSLNHKDLDDIEKALENGLTNIRAKQMELYNIAKKHEKTVEDENKELLIDFVPVALSNKSYSVSLDFSSSILLGLVDPFHTNGLMGLREICQLPSLVLLDGLNLLIHCFSPFFFFVSLLKTNQHLREMTMDRNTRLMRELQIDSGYHQAAEDYNPYQMPFPHVLPFQPNLQERM
ncbi:agamous-like MADS-box protein MADS9 [Malania oleifera]|uniref:agamous-like MADS-box protein MADS9 n=1 Tax=Malania oleifera TaxID=397392 RepID=UPI0025AE7B48|nr:agamous-like MADS-box protein MADS9 [Malania oleifera]